MKCSSCGYERTEKDEGRRDRCPSCGQNYFISRHSIRVERKKKLVNIDKLAELIKQRKESAIIFGVILIFALVSGVFSFKRTHVVREEEPVSYWVNVGVVVILIVSLIYSLLRKRKRRAELRDQLENEN